MVRARSDSRAEQRQKVESVDCWQNGFIGWDALVPNEPIIEGRERLMSQSKSGGLRSPMERAFASLTTTKAN